jgi:hypothetical protein
MLWHKLLNNKNEIGPTFGKARSLKNSIMKILKKSHVIVNRDVNVIATKNTKICENNPLIFIVLLRVQPPTDRSRCSSEIFGNSTWEFR